MSEYLYNAKDCRTVFTLRQADTFWLRLRGLLFTRTLPPREALLLNPCNSVHMFGMFYSLDIVYLDEDMRIVKTVPDLPPFGCSLCWKAALAVELPAGTIHTFNWQAGDQLRWITGEARGK